MADNTLLYTAVYDNLDDALTDLDALETLHEDAMIGKFDAAVIDQENGKPHIAKRMDRPRIRVIPEVFGSGALPRKELKDAARELDAGQAGLIAVGEPGPGVSWSRWSRRLVELPTQFLRALPLLAMVPLFQLWFGTYFFGQVLFVAYGVGVIVFAGVVNAVRNVPQIIRQRTIVRRVALPALPNRDSSGDPARHALR